MPLEELEVPEASELSLPEEIEELVDEAQNRIDAFLQHRPAFESTAKS